MSVLRQMYSWAIDESVLKRKDNPASRMQKNLPKQKRGETVLTLREARIVWQAAGDCGHPFGTHAQLMLLNGCRLDEVASAQESQIDLEEALHVIPADNYKSDHVHVVPLVPQAIEILKGIPRPTSGPYILSSTGGRTPIQGISKFFSTQLRDQIIANTGAPLSKHLTSHVLRRTVATRLAEVLGDEGDKLIKRVLGHSDGSVTAIYNRYGYVRRCDVRWFSGRMSWPQTQTFEYLVRKSLELPNWPVALTKHASAGCLRPAADIAWSRQRTLKPMEAAIRISTKGRRNIHQRVRTSR